MMYPACLISITRFTATMTVLAFVTLCHLDVSSAKSMGYSGGSWQSDRDFVKRNSWWSKKSMDSEPQYKDLTDSYTDYDGYVTGEPAEPEFLSSYATDCYSARCLPDYLVCVSRADVVRSLARCKRSHRICAAACLVLSPRDTK